MMLRNDEDDQKDVGSPNAMDVLIIVVQQHLDNLKVAHCPTLCKVMDHKPAEMLSQSFHLHPDKDMCTLCQASQGLLLLLLRLVCSNVVAK